MKNNAQFIGMTKQAHSVGNFIFDSRVASCRIIRTKSARLLSGNSGRFNKSLAAVTAINGVFNSCIISATTSDC